MKALKIVGIVLGILLLLTGGGLLAGSVLAGKGQHAFEQELARSGYAGPVQGSVQSVDQTKPVIITVSYTDKQGRKQTGQGASSGAQPPNIGDTVTTYYSTSDPSQIVVVNVPGLSNLSAVAATLRIAGIICLIAGGVLLLAGILGLALGKKSPIAVAAAPAYPPGQPGQPPYAYPTQPYPSQPSSPEYPPQQPHGQSYPPQQPHGQAYPPQQPPGQSYPPHPPGQSYPQQQPPSQPYPPQQYPPQQ
jgi:hypothetical protein